MAWSRARKAKFQATMARKKAAKRATSRVPDSVAASIDAHINKALVRENPTARRMQFAVSVDTTTVSLELSDDKLTELDIRKLIMNALARRNDLPELNYRLVEIL